MMTGKTKEVMPAKQQPHNCGAHICELCKYSQLTHLCFKGTVSKYQGTILKYLKYFQSGLYPPKELFLSMFSQLTFKEKKINAKTNLNIKNISKYF